MINNPKKFYIIKMKTLTSKHNSNFSYKLKKEQQLDREITIRESIVLKDGIIVIIGKKEIKKDKLRPNHHLLNNDELVRIYINIINV